MKFYSIQFLNPTVYIEYLTCVQRQLMSCQYLLGTAKVALSKAQLHNVATWAFHCAKYIRHILVCLTAGIA